MIVGAAETLGGPSQGQPQAENITAGNRLTPQARGVVPAIRRDPQTLLKLLVLSPVVGQAEESPSEPLF